jgi:hypothetical protein
MDKQKLDIIMMMAKQHGVRYSARRKWVQRGVPPKWQIILVRESDGLLTFDDFEKDAA